MQEKQGRKMTELQHTKTMISSDFLNVKGFIGTVENQKCK